MKKLFPFAALAIIGCGPGGGGPSSGTLSLAEGGTAKALLAGAGGSEHTDADQVPDIALDRAFTYTLILRDEKDEVTHLISTLIPHAKGITYSLVNEKVINDTIWQMTFKAELDENADRGLYLHSDHQVPVVFDGKDITEVELQVLDVNGNSTGEVGGVPGQPKTRKPKSCRWVSSQEMDPAMPPLEDIVIYTNGGKVEGERYLVGYARMKERSKNLSLKDDLAKNRVEFSADADTSGHRFLHFDRQVTAFNEAIITAMFPDGDGDTSNTPRETRELP